MRRRRRMVAKGALALGTLGFGLLLEAHAPAGAQAPAGKVAPTPPDWKGASGPIDPKLKDPALEGALNLHAHLDPDISVGGQAPRARDVIDNARMAKARGMRGFAYKTHMDISSAASAYLARKEVARRGSVRTVRGANPLPADCIAPGARALRANGVTDRQLDLMLKDNPAKFPGLRPPGAAVRSSATR